MDGVEAVASAPSISSADVGSPVTDVAVPGAPRRISELGTVGAQAPSGMVLLPELFGEQAKPAKQKTQELVQPIVEPMATDEAALAVVPADENVAEVMTDEEVSSLQFQEYQQFVDSPDIDIDKFGDKVMWYDADGKGEMVPIPLRDIPDHILRFNDYQRKTTELAAIKRDFERRDNGRKTWVEDVVSGDAERGLRAWRAIGGGETMHQMVLHYVREQAQLEQLPPVLRERFLRQQAAEDKAFFLERQNQQLQQRMQQQQTQQQDLGVNDPAVMHVQNTIDAALPEMYQALSIRPAEFETPAFQYHLEQVFTAAARGERNPDGTWKVAPTLQKGRTPSKALIRQLVQEVRAQTNMTVQKHGKPTKPRRATPPPTLSGSGPSAAPGQHGNIGQPQRMRFSDLGKPTR